MCTSMLTMSHLEKLDMIFHYLAFESINTLDSESCTWHLMTLGWAGLGVDHDYIQHLHACKYDRQRAGTPWTVALHNLSGVLERAVCQAARLSCMTFAASLGPLAAHV